MSEKTKDHEILGIEGNATKEQIKSAYYKKAKQHHPDSNKEDPNAQNKFIKIQQAYDNLNNPKHNIPIKRTYSTQSREKYYYTNTYKEIERIERIFDSFFENFRTTRGPRFQSPEPFVDLKKDLQRKRTDQFNREFNSFNTEFRELIKRFFDDF
ncbi:MAG: DnaJ domain-containing protein [Candidatus Lokiarchaeota archaeon]|nr:DnaJ domain-containing protein [Candidatus Lokiarchaeota archaeon]MBD3199610.1 DnaJ domain-containing protein [Candidatus Lokiarchaeota archaeon]